MTLSAIYLFNWFYSFSLNKLSLICFCNWKKKKLVWKIWVNSTKPATQLTRLKWPILIRDLFDPPTQLTRPELDSTRPFCHVYVCIVYKKHTCILLYIVKRCSRWLHYSRVAWQKMILSSAKNKWKIWGLREQAETPLRKPCDVDWCRSADSPSAQKRNKKGDMGSPCLKPRKGVM